MTFSTGLKKIYQTINKAPKEKQQALLFVLEEKILSNDALKYKYSLLEEIERNKGRFTEDVARRYIVSVKQKHNEFIKENNSVALFYREEKKLLEYFNVDVKSVVPSEMDLVISKKDNVINEAVLLSIVTNKKRMTMREAFGYQKAKALNEFRYIRNELDGNRLQRNLSFIKAKSANLSEKHRNMVRESVKTLQEKAFTDLKGTIEKAYKLRIITEKLLKEYPGEKPIVPPSASDPDDRLSDKDFEKFENYKEKTLKLGDVGSFKYVVLTVPQGKDFSKIELSFVLPVYPTSATMGRLMQESINLDKVFARLKVPFQTTMTQVGARLLSPANIMFDVFVDGKNLNPQDPKSAAGKQVKDKGCYAVAATFTLMISLKRRGSTEGFEQETIEILESFSEFVNSSDMLSDVVTPEIQKENLANATGGRSTEYNKEIGQGADKYYKDARTISDDSYTDDLLSGEAGDSEVKNRQDTEFYGDSDPDFKKKPKAEKSKQKVPAIAQEEFDDTSNGPSNAFNNSNISWGADDDDEFDTDDDGLDDRK